MHKLYNSRLQERRGKSTRAFAHKVLQSQRGVLEQDISPVLTNPSDLSLLDYPRLVRTSRRYSSMDDSLITGQGEYGPVSKSQHLQLLVVGL